MTRRWSHVDRDPSRIIVAASTAGDGGGFLALRAALRSVSDDSRPAQVWVPSQLDTSELPVSLEYRGFSRSGGVLQELIGPAGARDVHYIGMSDRLPMVRRPGRSTMVLQNNFLYGPPKRDFVFRTRARLAVLRWWARRSARRADVVVSATDASVPDLIAATGVARSNVRVRPIPPQDLPPPRSAQAVDIERILMVGRVEEYKRFDWAVGIVDRWAAARDRSLTLVHVGGPTEAPAEWALQEAAEAVNAIDVCLLGGLDHLSTIREMERADLLVLPSSRESYGLPLAESLGIGLPTVCAEIPQFRELAGDAAEYFVDEPTLFAALDRTQSGDHRRWMANEGVRRVRANEGWDVLSGLGDGNREVKP